jgi:chromatin assembly factor 1 subunit B
MTSSDGFCSCLTFASGELGQVYHGTVPAKNNVPSSINTATSSTQTTPTPTPTSAVPPPPKQQSQSSFPASPSSFNPARPSSPTRSMSQSSVGTQSSMMQSGEQTVLPSTATPIVGHIPSVAAMNSATPGMPLWTHTPPMTPMPGGHGTHSASSSVSGIINLPGRRESESESEATKETRKREADTEKEEGSQPKKRRIAPTLISTEGNPTPPAPVTE